MNPFDHFVKRELRCPGYVRFVDDLLLFGDDAREMGRWKRALERRLEGLHLTVHPGAHPRPVTEGFRFLGFVVYPTRRRLKRRNAVQFRRRLRALVDAFAARRIGLDRVTASVCGWVNHARYGNTVGLRKAVLDRPLSGG